MFSNIRNYRKELDFANINEDRKGVLDVLVDYISEKKKTQVVNLNFICTHNSRRSQLAQIWAATAAEYYNVKINALSGGIEVTEFNERAIAALEKAGFEIESNGKNNPVYTVKFDRSHPGLKMYSKLFDAKENKKGDFAAIMTCSDVGESCPYIPNAEIGIPLYYEDPKIHDNTSLERRKYDRRCTEIATEMFYVFSNVN